MANDKLCNDILIQLWLNDRSDQAHLGVTATELKIKLGVSSVSINAALKHLHEPHPVSRICSEYERHSKLPEREGKANQGRKARVYELVPKVVVTCPCTAYLILRVLAVRGLDEDSLVMEFLRHGFSNPFLSDPVYDEVYVRKRIRLASQENSYLAYKQDEPDGKLVLRRTQRAVSEQSYLEFLSEKLVKAEAKGAAI